MQKVQNLKCRRYTVTSQALLQETTVTNLGILAAPAQSQAFCPLLSPLGSISVTTTAIPKELSRSVL